jgi:class 3 adenylate cyclase/tetratricopeptide (TPR) repeat protein
MPEERRVVTILFADVMGSTALGESSDPEDVRAVLGRYYAIAREVIGAHGGTLEKFIGDAVMAVFGLPQAHGDDAERALSAALGLREGVARDPATAGLALRIGVNTGEVVATREAGAGDFLVTGDPVNVAARLQQSAEPGAILVGDRTCRAAMSAYRFGETQHLSVKGKREPIAGAVLLERAERRTPRTPFLGREHDLAQLDLVAKRAFSEKRPQLVTITAPAGTGKSRLVDEFVSRLDHTDLTVATAQCLPYGSAVTFLPLRGLARGLLGVDADTALTAPLRDAFVAGGYGEQDAHRLAGLIAATLGDANESERADRDEIFNAWRLLVEALAGRGPLLIIFEDLHWASDTLLDLVEHVTGSRAGTPLVMVALARPELLDRRPLWGGGRRNFSSIALEPLSADDTRRLVAVMTEGMPGPIAQRIAERAGGNPFFAGELVRAFEDRRRAGQSDDEIRLPDTVHATVLARIDALPGPERTVLEYAAVAGRTARSAAVRALLPEMDAGLVDASLATLVEREMLLAQGAGSFTFRHIVIREVAYATLARTARVGAHLRLASWLEDDGTARGDELAELIAYHYRQAIALSPGGRLPEGLRIETVVKAFEQAARAAWNGGAFVEAAHQLREAIRLAPLAEHLRLYELLGDVMRFGDDSVNGYEEAFQRWRSTPDADARTGARIRIKQLGVYARWQGSITRTLGAGEFDALVTEAADLLQRAPDASLQAKLALCRAFRASVGGTVEPSELRRLIGEAEGARRFFADRGEIEAVSEALDAIGSLQRDLGEPETAIESTKERLAMSDRLGTLERADAWNMVSWDLTVLCRFEETVRTFDQAMATLRPGEAESMFSHLASWAGYSAMQSGDWDRATTLCDFLIACREQSGPSVGRFTTPGWIGGLHVAAARQDTTMLARYRSMFATIADPASLPAGNGSRLLYEAMLEDDPLKAHASLAAESGARERRVEAIRLLVFTFRERIEEGEMARFEAQVLKSPPLIDALIQLGRAMNGDAAAIRAAIDVLDGLTARADAARTAALLALRTHTASDRADAERRLAALGDRQYLQLLADEW